LKLLLDLGRGLKESTAGTDTGAYKRPIRPGGESEEVLSMTHVELWTYRDTTLNQRNLSGLKVEALDGSIGKVDDATNDVGGSFIVVDTGPWIFGKKVMLPAGVVNRVDLDTETVFVNRTKDQIKNAPEYDEDKAKTDDKYRERYRSDLGSYYGPGGLGYRDDELI
jgi:hypothetical protein